MDENDSKAAELEEIIRQIRERVRLHGSGTDSEGLALPDLMPAIHARDAALGKVASIGMVNPRPGGFLNDLIQGFKRLIARGLNWHIREQVAFNRAVLQCVESTLEIHQETNRGLATLGHRVEALAEDNSRAAWDAKLAELEARITQAAAEREAAIYQLVTQEFAQSLDTTATEIQERLWADLQKVRLEYESLIHHELRILRQRAVISPVSQAPEPTRVSEFRIPTMEIDWLQFAQKFRGSSESVKQSMERYVSTFRECSCVLDLGCGRGEFMELMREAGVPAKGVDFNQESIALCRDKGLDAERADIFAYLASQSENSLGGIFCAQVIEHLQPAELISLVRLCASRLQPGAPIVFETPNPECLAIFATHFFIDPTHVRPVPSALLAFYLEEAGLAQIEVTRLAPAVETMPSVEKLPTEFRQQFFDGLDYAISARKIL